LIEKCIEPYIKLSNLAGYKNKNLFMNVACQNSILKLTKNIMIRFSDFLTEKLTTLPANNFFNRHFYKKHKKISSL